mgnify:CR=1 FL=1
MYGRGTGSQQRASYLCGGRLGGHHIIDQRYRAAAQLSSACRLDGKCTEYIASPYFARQIGLVCGVLDPQQQARISLAIQPRRTTANQLPRLVVAALGQLQRRAHAGETCADNADVGHFLAQQLGIDLNQTYHKLNGRAQNYGQDRKAQKLGDFTGIRGFPNQDIAMWETMGSIANRGDERLGASDLAIVQFRRTMVEAVQRFMKGEPAIGST